MNNYFIIHGSYGTPYKQDYESWNTILMSYLKIGYITVAGFNNIQFDKDNSLYDSFYIRDEDLTKICDLCYRIICIYSDNDPYIPINKAESFADRIKGQKVLINNAGHFNEKYGYKEFREILEYI